MTSSDQQKPVAAPTADDGERTVHAARPADTLPAASTHKAGRRHRRHRHPRPQARTRPGSSFLGKCKHADPLCRPLPGLADLIAQADALRNDPAEVKDSRPRHPHPDERARVLQMGGRPCGVEGTAAPSADDIARGDHVAYHRRGAQPEECIVEEITNGKARIRRPSGRRLTVPPRRLSSLIPF